jgi:hypothetical protein
MRRFPEEPGQADIEYRPPTDGFEEPWLASVLRLFAAADLISEESPVTVRWDFVERQLGRTRGEIEDTLELAKRRGLLPGMTIDYDHERWMHQSANKGCLVALTCIEKADLTRDRSEVVGCFVATIEEIRGAITNGGSKRLERTVIMPNAHLNPRGEPVTDRDGCVLLLEELRDGLAESGIQVELNSYGYSKMMAFAINAHPLGYVLRVI